MLFSLLIMRVCFFFFNNVCLYFSFQKCDFVFSTLIMRVLFYFNNFCLYAIRDFRFCKRIQLLYIIYANLIFAWSPKFSSTQFIINGNTFSRKCINNTISSYKKISMDPSEFPFDIEVYKKQCELEERYIVHRFTERRKKLRKTIHLAARENTSREIM